ncbi:MAG: 30S ribosomal protein S6 [Desulfobacterales bacterium]|nr:30S ribosomal protein S6 [Desulfobacterales bacterium]
MRRYETVFIANPDLSQEERQPLLDKLNNITSGGQGFLVKFDEWGHRKLAYEVNKQARGYYVLMNFCGNGSMVKELERNMRLDDRVLKYMTVLVDEHVDVEALKAQIEAAKEQKSEPEPAQEGSQPEETGAAAAGNTPESTIPETEAAEDASSSEQEEPANGTVQEA